MTSSMKVYWKTQPYEGSLHHSRSGECWKLTQLGLTLKPVVRAVEYIQDQLGTELTVSGIAQAVGLSPYHFTKLFKESTGQSPHQYVVEARVRKAKELLTTGRFTISEVAHHVGFADQSHLTRHFKRVFGLPPNKLLRRLQVVV